MLSYRQGRIAEALEGLELLRREQPFYAPVYLNLAVIRRDLEELDAAERLVRRALELRPAYGLAHELHALTLEEQGRRDEARIAWEMARRFALGEAARGRAEKVLASWD